MPRKKRSKQNKYSRKIKEILQILQEKEYQLKKLTPKQKEIQKMLTNILVFLAENNHLTQKQKDAVNNTWIVFFRRPKKHVDPIPEKLAKIISYRKAKIRLKKKNA